VEIEGLKHYTQYEVLVEACHVPTGEFNSTACSKRGAVTSARTKKKGTGSRFTDLRGRTAKERCNAKKNQGLVKFDLMLKRSMKINCGSSRVSRKVIVKIL
jgi:hypothetical protein